MRRNLFALVAILALVALPAFAGQYHSGATLLCYDCHTPHASMQHAYDGGAVVTNPNPPGGGVPGAGENWLPNQDNPNAYLLKLPPNQLCLACHDAQGFAPDVYGDNNNTTGLTQGRRAGALNGTVPGHTAGANYQDFKGHTMGSTTAPPGYNPAAVGIANATWYVPANGLECVNCHAQHGPATAYRNLGSYALGGSAGSFRPTYYFSTTADSTTTTDVRVNMASYTAGSGNPATFNPYYDQANIQFQRNDTTLGTTQTSNRMDSFCGSCHGNFHGGAGDANIGATGAALDGFLRHPTSAVNIGAAGAQGYGGHSSLPNYVANVNKVPVYTNDHTGYTNTTPGCVSCHKAHGNQNPFGLYFLAPGVASPTDASGVTEEGAWEVAQTTHDFGVGSRNLCGQCHGQGSR